MKIYVKQIPGDMMDFIQENIRQALVCTIKSGNKFYAYIQLLHNFELAFCLDNHSFVFPPSISIYLFGTLLIRPSQISSPTLSGM